MYDVEFIIALTLGITFSTLFADYFGIIPAGIIVPSYLALVFDQPMLLAGILLIAALAYYSVNALSQYLLLYGRRKFAAMILVALLIKITMTLLWQTGMPDFLSLQGLGVIIPGLVANCFDRQGVVVTIVSMFFVGGLTYVGILTYLLLL